MQTPADKGEGVQNWQNLADVYYGWPPLLRYYAGVLLPGAKNQKQHTARVLKHM